MHGEALSEGVARGPSLAARERLLSRRGEPLFYSDWLRAVFIHYEVEQEALQRAVPFLLDLREGRAYVSLVAFTMRGLRPRIGGKVASWLFAPIATHELLNVRTYVRHRGEPGIFFLAEWVPNRLSAWFGPRTFGLPYRHGRLDYRHRPEHGALNGMVCGAGGRLVYESAIDSVADFYPCAPDSPVEFLLERYTAFTCQKSRRQFFRIWHPPWRQVEIEVRVLDDSLLRASFLWFRNAQLVGANYAPIAGRVWMGWPHRLTGAF